MAERRQQPSRAAKNKPAPTTQASSGSAGSAARVTKKPAPKKAATKKTGAQSAKKKAPSTKRKAPASSERAQKATIQDRANEADDAPSDGPAEAVADDPSYEEILDRLPALATTDSRTDCTFEENAAELMLSLKVFSHPSNVSRLGYYAKIRLTIDDADAIGQTSDGNAIGFVHAWRISKPTSALPLVDNVWLEEILSADDKNADMSETSMCLCALFNENGTTRPVVDTNAPQLESNPLMFVETIYIKPEFQRNGLLGPALECFYVALAQLPEWFAFAGTLVLVPGGPKEVDVGEAWKEMTDRTVEKILVKAYSNRGFEVWVRNGPSRGYFVTVMGRATPGRDQDDSEF